MSDESSFHLDAAGLRADGADLSAGVEVLAGMLEQALPDSTSVRRRSRRLLSKEKLVSAVEVRLGETRYSLAVAGRDVDAFREREVRGVVIRREPLSLDAWVQALVDELRAEAATSAQARAALDRLIG